MKIGQSLKIESKEEVARFSEECGVLSKQGLMSNAEATTRSMSKDF